MTDFRYELLVTIDCIDVEEDAPEPLEHVADAVQRLLDDNFGEWLREAIGHPNCDDWQVKVAGKADAP